MSILTATLDKLTAWLGADPATQQDVVYSEASARKALSRRDFLRTAGAVAAGTLFVDQAAEAAKRRGPADYEYRIRAYPELRYRRPSQAMHFYDYDALARAGWAEPRSAEQEAKIVQLEEMYTKLGEDLARDIAWRSPFQNVDRLGDILTVTGISHERGIITLDSAPRRVI